MKKALLVILLSALAFAASAQDLPKFSDLKDFRKESSEKAKSDFLMLDYIGYGIHGMASGDANYLDNTKFFVNREIYFNLFGFVVRLGSTGNHAFTLGVDLDWDNYRLDNSHVWVPSDKKVRVGTLSEVGMKSVSRSVLRVLSFDIPLDYTLSVGDLNLTLGASAQLSLPASTRFVGNDMSDNEVRNTKSGPLRATDIKTNTFTWNAHAQITFAHLGFYGKYSPMPVFAEGFGPQFATWTVGLILR